MSRKTHLVGAWPGFSGARAMDTALARLGPHLLRLTDGETGERSQWIAPAIDWMRANPDVEMVADGDFSDYERGPWYRLREGRQLDPANIELGYYLAFKRSYRAFKVLRQRAGYPNISFQVGCPAPIDLAHATLGYEEPHPEAGKMPIRRVDPAIVQAFSEATVGQIDAIYAEAKDDVIFQVESVVAMVAVARAAPQAQQAVATAMAESIVAMVAQAPEGARFGVHICLGDFHHRALAELGSARPLVTLANTLAKLWPAGRPLEYIHAPFAAAEKPGSFDPAWYAPLDELTLPDDVRFVAGFVHEDVDIDELRKIHAMIEQHAGREVDVAATCGLGRRPSPDEAWDAMDKVVQLLA